MENILVVEDSVLQGKMLTDLLEENGFEVDLCESGESAFTKINDKKIDLILLDMMLPDISGVQLIKKIKSAPNNNNIPIIVVSGLTDKENVIESLGLGIHDYLTKPYHSKELINRINIHLQLQRAQKKLSQANAANDKFLSVLGHDLKNSFSELHSAFDLIENHIEDREQQKAMLREAKSTNLRVNSLLDELLLWGKVINKGIVQHNERFDLNIYAREVLNKYSENIYAKGIEIIDEIEGQAYVMADKNMIEAVIRNVLSNAKKFTKRGGSISVASQMINLEEGDFHNVSIRDTGVGMTSEMIKDLFRNTYQNVSPDTEGALGVGLGLSIVKDFVKKNEGKIEVESIKGEGSVVSIQLPALV